MLGVSHLVEVGRQGPHRNPVEAISVRIVDLKEGSEIMPVTGVTIEDDHSTAEHRLISALQFNRHIVECKGANLCIKRCKSRNQYPL